MKLLNGLYSLTYYTVSHTHTLLSHTHSTQSIVLHRSIIIPTICIKWTQRKSEREMERHTKRGQAVQIDSRYARRDYYYYFVQITGLAILMRWECKRQKQFRTVQSSWWCVVCDGNVRSRHYRHEILSNGRMVRICTSEDKRYKRATQNHTTFSWHRRKQHGKIKSN